jgi:glutaminyl-peptide cyclotransferase
MKRYSALTILIFFAACNSGDKQADHDDSLTVAPIPLIKYNIMSVYPHDTSAYTQGLEFYNGKLYEGTGDFKNSSLRITDYKTGKVEKKHMMGTDTIFGEGITILKNKIYQLTWRSHIIYVYDIKNIEKPIATFKWPYEGWGLTNNGTDLIISTGSANLYFVNPDDFKVKSTISVNDNGGPIDSINELEYVDGVIYANVYETEFIIKIDPASGHVLGKMDLTGIIQKFAPNYIPEPMDEVLNGIAYDSATKKFLVTGKRWPKMFELKVD